MLPSQAELERMAADCPYPVMMHVIGHDLCIHAVAGQLAPLLPGRVGKHVADLDTQPHRPKLRATIRALNGETVTTEVENDGQRWVGTLTPLHAPDGAIIGALCVSRLAASAEPIDGSADAPLLFRVARALPGYEVGELVSVRPRDPDGIWGHRRISQTAFDGLLALSILMPIATAPAWLRRKPDDVQIAEHPAPAAPRLRLYAQE